MNSWFQMYSTHMTNISRPFLQYQTKKNNTVLVPRAIAWAFALHASKKPYTSILILQRSHRVLPNNRKRIHYSFARKWWFSSDLFETVKGLVKTLDMEWHSLVLSQAKCKYLLYGTVAPSNHDWPYLLKLFQPNTVVYHYSLLPLASCFTFPK